MQSLRVLDKRERNLVWISGSYVNLFDDFAKLS